MIRRFTLLEILTALAIMMVLLALGLPAVHDMQLRAKSVELNTNGEALLDATIAFQVATDNNTVMYEKMPSGTPTKQARPWPALAGDFDLIGFRPDGDVYGEYHLYTAGTTTETGGMT